MQRDMIVVCGLTAIVGVITCGLLTAEESSYQMRAVNTNLRSDLNGNVHTPIVITANSGGAAIDPATEATLLGLSSGIGATGDAAATQGSTGSVSAKLRTVTSQLNTLAGYLDGVESGLSPLALESGGNLAAAATSLGLLDDSLDGGRVNVSGLAAIVTNSTTRPSDTTAYASGDLIANNTTSTSVVPIPLAVARGTSGSAATGIIPRLRLNKTTSTTTNASFRVHLYNAAPGTISNGDNGAWLTSGSANYMGAFDISTDRAFTDGASGNGSPITGNFVTFALTGTNTIFALIEARGAYAPGNAEVFTVTAEVLRN